MRRLRLLEGTPLPPRRVGCVAGALLVGLLAGCGTAIPSSNGGSTVKAMQSEFGRVLTDGAGHTLYLFARDQQGESYCNGACAAVWPPYETDRTPHAVGIPAGALGTIKLPDGDMQVTFHGHPLYYYAADASRPGNTKGEELTQFGSPWYLVGPNGTPVEKSSSGGGSGGSGSGGSGSSGNGGSWG